MRALYRFRGFVVALAIVPTATTVARDAFAADKSAGPRKAGAGTELAQCQAKKVEETTSTEETYQLALCASRRGDWAGALNAFTRWLEDPQVPADRKKTVRERLLLPLVPRAARLVFVPEDARVTIDGKEAPTSSGVVYVPTGEHRIRASSAEASVDIAVVVAAGATKLVEIPRPAEVSRAAVISDGEERGAARAAAPRMQPLLAASVSGSSASAQSSAGAEGSEAPAPEMTGTSPMRVVLTLAGVALAAAGAGAGLMVWSHEEQIHAVNLRREANLSGQSCYGRNNATCEQVDDLATKAGVKQTAAIGCFAGAGAFFVSALITYLAWPGAGTVRVGAAPTTSGAVAGGMVRF